MILIGKGIVFLDVFWIWLVKGWRDLISVLFYSLFVGLMVVMVGSGIMWFFWKIGNFLLIFIVFSVFVFVGLIYVVSFYEISCWLESGDCILFGRFIFV